MGKELFFATDEEYGMVLQPLGGMDGGEFEAAAAVLLRRILLVLPDQRGLFEEVVRGRLLGC